MDDALDSLARRLGESLKAARLTLTTAESCTGGWIAKVITDVPGSSSWFDRGFITYTNAAKTDMLGVDAASLERHGAVSEQTARAMAAGALSRSSADLSVSVTGIAGPDGGSEEKPVGTVWLAWADRRGDEVKARSFLFSGDRRAVREASVKSALSGILERIEHG